MYARSKIEFLDTPSPLHAFREPLHPKSTHKIQIFTNSLSLKFEVKNSRRKCASEFEF